MQNEGRLYSQVAAMAGVTTDKAMVACYLSNLAKDGKTLDEAAALILAPRSYARDYARDWGISFSDYSTASQPLTLTWTKAKRGRWELMLDGLPFPIDMWLAWPMVRRMLWLGLFTFIAAIGVVSTR